MTTYAPDLPDMISTPTATTVATVVVTARTTDGLRPLLDAVLAQSTTTDLLVVLDRTAEGGAAEVLDALAGSDIAVRVIGQPDEIGVRAAVTALLATPDIVPDEALLWLLPAGVVPHSDALALLVAAHRRSTAVVAAGPKLLDATDPRVLRSVGIQATSSGRLVQDPAEGTRDQRQYDTRRDVIAVPFAGSLVRADAVRALKGWEPSFGDVAADLDLGWRLHLRGGRVEMAPAARVHAAQGVGEATGSTGIRRRAARRVALARASWWTAPLLALWIGVGSILSGLALLLLKRPRASAAEFGDLLALDPVRWITVKVRRPAPVRVRRRHLTALFVPAAELRRRVTDDVSESLFPARRSDPGADRDADQTSTLVRVLTNPGLLATLTTIAVVAAAARSLGAQVVGGLSGGLIGGELTGGRADAASLWSAWADGWTGSGLGHDGSGSPALALLAAATWVLEHLPGTGSLASTMGAATAWMLLLTPPAACVSAYVSARVLTTNRWLRGAAGRVGTLAALVLIPLILSGLALLARPDGTATAAWATTLGLVVLTAFAPLTALGVLGLALILVLAAVPGARLRAVVPVIAVPLGTLLWWPGLLEDWRQVLVGPGMASWNGPVLDPWRRALLDTGELGSPPLWAAAPVVALGVMGLLRGRRLRSMSTALAVLGLGGLAVALAAGRIILADVPQAVGHGPITPWAGSVILLLPAALLAGAVLALDQGTPAESSPAEGTSGPRRWRTAGRGLSGLCAVAMVGAACAGLVIATLGTALAPWSEARPAVAVEHADGPLAGRTLFVSPTDIGPGFRLVGRESAGPARGLPATTVSASVADTVSALLEGSALDTSADSLRALAVGFVALDAELGDDISRRLDATSGLTRLASRGGWQVWRVTAVATADEAPIGPPRVSIVGPAGPRAVDVTGLSAATVTDITAEPGDVLQIAEGAGWASRAAVTLEGVVLVPTEATYALPGGGHLEIEVRRGPAWLPPLQLAGIVALLFLAIPFGSRASRTRGRTS